MFEISIAPPPEKNCLASTTTSMQVFLYILVLSEQLQTQFFEKIIHG